MSAGDTALPIVRCRRCNQTWGPYEGSRWSRPVESAQRALGGIRQSHEHPDAVAVEPPEVRGDE